MTTWFTAEHHFGHANILRFRGRPFSDVGEMDEVLIERWNEVVGPGDDVWHLGDFAHRCRPNRRAEIFARLRGRAIHLVRGRHDRRGTLDLPWASVQHYAEVAVQGRDLVLLHYAMRVWNGSHLGSLSLHGHDRRDLPRVAGSCDVGVDLWDFRPVHLDGILARIGSAERRDT